MTETDSASPRPGVVSAAYYVALVLGLVSLGVTPWNPGGLIQGPLFLIAAWGIRNRRAWSAYGLALLTLVLSAVPFANEMISGPGFAKERAASLAVAMLFSLTMVLLLFFAGRAMDRAYGRRGMAWPWVAATVFFGSFFLLFGLY
jgi:hypothetical protein